MKSIAVLMTVFNRKRETLLCLEKLSSCFPVEGYRWEVYLMNDGCTDGTPEEVKKRFPEVHILNGDGSSFWNRGMYMAWNEAAKQGYDYYLWLNDDTIVSPRLWKVLMKEAQLKENKAIIAGACQGYEHKRMTYGGFLKWGKKVIPNGRLQEIDYFNGNIVLVPKWVYERVGNLDYKYRHSGGDFDYGLRAIKKGIRSFLASEYLGECNRHTEWSKWCNPVYPLKERWKHLWSPLGESPSQVFYFERKYKGKGIAVFHFFTVCLRCLFPSLWIKLGKGKF